MRVTLCAFVGVIAILIAACGSSGSGGPHGDDAQAHGDGASMFDGTSANACYLAGNTGTGSANDTDCCFGYQCKTDACCRAGGAVCNGNAQCCNNRCMGGTCACAMPGGTCSDDYDCCAGESCKAGTCVSRGGAVCNGGSQCATGNCNGSTCVAHADGASCSSTLDCGAASECRSGVCCRQGGAVCSQPSDCCSGSCTGGRCDCAL